jgi:hypothetical protein
VGELAHVGSAKTNWKSKEMIEPPILQVSEDSPQSSFKLSKFVNVSPLPNHKYHTYFFFKKKKS